MLDDDEKEIKRLRQKVDLINNLEADFTCLCRRSNFHRKLLNLRQRLKQGEKLDDILPEAFALVREASRRTLGMRHFDVQLIGGMVLA
jgi:preprotein translocase subunit SecA